jgi:hypothetical protein
MSYNMAELNADHITTLPKGLEVIERNYLDHIQNYLTTKKITFNAKNYTMSYQ